MEVTLAYGSGQISCDIPVRNLAGILHAKEIEAEIDSREVIRQALNNPIGSGRLSLIVKEKKAQSAAVIVNDLTRPTPHKLMLPPLLEDIEKAGIPRENIKLIIANGIHRHHTQKENQALFGDFICSNYQLENHNCDDNLVSLGKLSNGMDLIINRSAAEADILITTGLVNPHYFAGYSGGRKSILPGIAARQLIEANHRMMDDSRARLGNYTDNPVNELMLEAAYKAKVAFILNVVTNSRNQIAFCVAGDFYQAWMRAVEFCERSQVVTIKEKADIVIASCGGVPKDMNLYQAQKALDAAALAVKSGGSIILVAECREGLGEKNFKNWMEKATCCQDIVDRFYSSFELGGHKAYAICRVLEKAEVILYSQLPQEVVRNIFLISTENVEAAIDRVLDKHGREEARILVMPEASKLVLKVLEQE